MKQEELNKYLDIKKFRGSDYGGFNHAKNHYGFLRKILDVGPMKVCDFGCGTGKFPLWVKENFPQHEVLAVDPVFVEEGFRDGVSFLKGDSTHLPLSRVDLLTSFDVMEHIHPDDLDDSMREITRVSDYYVAKIAYAPSKGRGVNGEELHPLVRSESWWFDHLRVWYERVDLVGGIFVCKISLSNHA